MNDSELDAAVAERVMGWKKHPHVGRTWIENGWKWHSHWSPTEDPAQARMVEDEIDRRELIYAYIRALIDITEMSKSPNGLAQCWLIAHATPLQRCEAALRAAGGNQEA